MEDTSTDKQHKVHRAPKSGMKYEKKKRTAEQRREKLRKNPDEADADIEEPEDPEEARRKAMLRNPRAFSISGAHNARIAQARKAEKIHRKLHPLIVDRSTQLAQKPPVIVAVSGPKGSGKSTLISSLIKHYTRKNVTDIKGPITVIAGKKRRLTFIEVPNDMNAMVDAAKIADIVLLTIDGHFGFEMETFEMLNILQVHGFPKVMGILTHMDLFDKAKHIKHAKKALKKRFEEESFAGAKLFHLSGCLRGRYPKMEILNLARFLSIMKLRPLVWRNSHPYMIADRMEDLTASSVVQQDHTVDRTVSLYGYLHGTNFKSWMKVHVAGVGDFSVREIRKLHDPCPLPGSENEGEKKRRTLNDKQKLIYAPMADLGDLVYDKDAVYINLPSNVARDHERHSFGIGEEMIQKMQSSTQGMDEQLEEGSIPVFASSVQTVASADDDQDEVDADGHRVALDEKFENIGEGEDGSADKEDVAEEEDMFEDSDEKIQASFSVGGSSSTKSTAPIRKWKNIMLPVVPNLLDLIYGVSYTQAEEDAAREDEESLRELHNSFAEEEDIFFKSGLQKSKRDELINAPDSSKAALLLTPDELPPLRHHALPRFKGNKDDEDVSDIEDEDTLVEDEDGEEDPLVSRFIPLDSFGDGFVNDDEDGDAAYGDWEDLETGEKGGKMTDEERMKKEDEERARKKEAQKKAFDEYYETEKQQKGRIGDDDDSGVKAHGTAADAAGIGDDDEYYEIIQKQTAAQLKLNAEEFAKEDESTRTTLAGVSAGVYVRLVLDNVPCEFVEGFRPQNPIVVGGLLMNEDQLGLIQARVKKHRWHKKILKNRDPLIVSLGWRRFQTVVTYSMPDTKNHHRVIKYTPEHLHCTATFFGPLTAPGSGMCAFQCTSEHAAGFRLAASGVVLELDQSFRIVKKLKLTGTPLKVYRNTAFIQKMFSSAQEVAKFENAKIRTVSGIRGAVKHALRTPPGAFRATFEDKILMSDIVFLRAWVPVEPAKFYNPVTNLLGSWAAMRTVREVRADRGLPIPSRSDTGGYGKVDRPEKREFKPLRIPGKLLGSLPYDDVPKQIQEGRQAALERQRTRGVILEKSERDTMELVRELAAITQEKSASTKAKRAEKARKERREQELEEEKRQERIRERKKNVAHILYASKRPSSSSRGDSKRPRKE